MKADKIKTFMELAGQEIAGELQSGDEKKRALGAQLLLSEVLEYVIHGLGITPQIGDTVITDPDDITYVAKKTPNKVEMLDGLADVAYTMYWNANAFGIPLEEAFELVCDNNLEKFVKLNSWDKPEGKLDRSEWHTISENSSAEVTWPEEVDQVEVIKIGVERYAVGKDSRGKVRKPSHYQTVDLASLIKQQ